jgi:hypothetical protein
MYPMSDFITAKTFTSLNKKILVCYEMSGEKKVSWNIEYYRKVTIIIIGLARFREFQIFFIFPNQIFLCNAAASSATQTDPAAAVKNIFRPHN